MNILKIEHIENISKPIKKGWFTDNPLASLYNARSISGDPFYVDFISNDWPMGFFI